MLVRVDEERCQGHGLCRLSAPDIFFAREEDGHAYVLSETVPEGHEDETQLAADSCPGARYRGRVRGVCVRHGRGVTAALSPSGRARPTRTTGSPPRPRWPTADGSPTSGSTASPSGPWRWPTRRRHNPAPARTSGSAGCCPCCAATSRRAAGWSATSARPTRTRRPMTSSRGWRSLGLPGVRLGVIRRRRPRPGPQPGRRAARAGDDGQSVGRPDRLGQRLHRRRADRRLPARGRADRPRWPGRRPVPVRRADLPRARLVARRLGGRRPRDAGRPPSRVRSAQHRRQLRGPALPGRPTRTGSASRWPRCRRTRQSSPSWTALGARSTSGP